MDRTHEVAEYNLLHVHMYNMCSICTYVYAHVMSEVDKIMMQASPAYTSVAMTTPMRPQCEDGVPPKYMNVNI